MEFQFQLSPANGLFPLGSLNPRNLEPFIRINSFGDDPNVLCRQVLE